MSELLEGALGKYEENVGSEIVGKIRYFESDSENIEKTNPVEASKGCIRGADNLKFGSRVVFF